MRYKYFSRDSSIAKHFYFCLFIIEVVRATTLIIACTMYKVGIDEEQVIALKAAMTASTKLDEIDLIPAPLFLFIIMPDFLFIIAFLILFWQLLSLFNIGHANLFKVMS